MGWIIAAILLVCLIVSSVFIVKTIKEKKRVQYELEHKFQDYIKARVRAVEEKENERREELHRDYEQDVKDLEHQKTLKKLTIDSELSYLKNEVEKKRTELEAEKSKINEVIASSQRVVEAEVQAFKKEQMAIARDEISEKTLRENNDFLALIASHREFQMKAEDEEAEIREQLEDFRKRREAINEAILREKKVQEQENFYKIVLTNDDLEDMEMLRGIIPRMRNRDIIPKLIWESILRRPTQEMIKRVTQNRDISGIYKVTYIKTGESYIGKSTNIRARWTNHCKTAIGLEAAASSTFHTRLARDGVENYTWEILEEVAPDKLSEREKYYIELYGTKDNGMNIKEGG